MSWLLVHLKLFALFRVGNYLVTEFLGTKPHRGRALFFLCWKRAHGIGLFSPNTCSFYCLETRASITQIFCSCSIPYLSIYPGSSRPLANDISFLRLLWQRTQDSELTWLWRLETTNHHGERQINLGTSCGTWLSSFFSSAFLLSTFSSPNFLSIQRHQSHWTSAQPHGLALTSWPP